MTFNKARNALFSFLPPKKSNENCYTMLIKPSSTGKLKNSIFEIPIIPQTLNINNQRTTSAESINLDIIKKLIEYSLKNVFFECNVYSYRFRDIAVRSQYGIMTGTAGYRERNVKSFKATSTSQLICTVHQFTDFYMKGKIIFFSGRCLVQTLCLVQIYLKIRV